MTDGTVQSFNLESGFGFIQPDDGSKPIFIHIATVRRAGLSELMEGQRVTYDRCSGPYGTFTARNLVLQ